MKAILRWAERPAPLSFTGILPILYKFNVFFVTKLFCRNYYL